MGLQRKFANPDKTQDPDKLENLPVRQAMPDYSWEKDRYHGWNVPYDRLHRWLESCVGRHLDDVISEYTHANWMPKEFRVPHQLYKYLEVNTLKIGGQTCYHDDHHGCYRPIEGCAVRTVYVHPITKQLCLYIPPTRKSWRKAEQEELDARVRFLGDYHQLYKVNGGLWFEVKAEILSSPSNLKPKSIILETVQGFMPSFRVVLKRQLSSKELKKFGLKNDVVLRLQKPSWDKNLA